MSHIQFDNIYYGTGTTIGKIRFASIGVAWKAAEDEQTITVAAGDIKYLQWFRVARNFQLRIILKQDRKRETFEGFLREDHDKIASVVKQYYNLILEHKEIGVKGWNWGVTDVRGGDLAFLVSNKTIFEVPLSRIGNSNIAGKTEVSLEFTPQPGVVAAPGKKGKSVAIDELVEMRLFVPGARVRGSDEEASGPEDDETSAAQAFHDMIKEKAEIGQVTGQGIVTFSDILVQTPRGRYDIDMFPTFLRLRGKTYDYKILYSSITRIFLLPKPDEIHVQLVIGLDPPIRQGQTRYPYLVLIFSREEELDIELNLDQETIDTKYEGKLQQRYDLPTYRVVSEVFRGLSGRKMIAPGNFASRDNQHGIKANMKAVLGELYFLEKSLIFVAKQPTVIDYADIHQVVFSRVGGGMSSARTFDIRVVSKSSTDVTFTSINKEEFEPVDEFLKSKKIRTKNEINEGDVLMAATALDEDSDEEMESGSSGDEKPTKKINFDDEDSEEDADFHASETDEGSPTESDSESGASDVSDASGDLDIIKTATPKKKKKKGGEDGGGDDAAPKKKKKVKKDGGDADMKDAEGEGSKSKPKAKAKPKGDDPEEPAKKKPKLASN